MWRAKPLRATQARKKNPESRSWRGAPLAWLLVAGLSLAPRGSATGVTSEEAAIEKGVAWLLSAQGVDGSWRNQAWKGMPTGVTALAAYTLLECGVDPDHRAITLAAVLISLGQRRPGPDSVA